MIKSINKFTCLSQKYIFLQSTTIFNQDFYIDSYKKAIEGSGIYQANLGNI